MPDIYTFYNEIPLWLSELLPKEIHAKHVNNDIENLEKHITNKSILICSNKEEEFVSCCERKQLEYGIISISDEANKNFMGYATSELCKFIVRGYLHPHLIKVLRRFGMTNKSLHLHPGYTNKFFREAKNTNIIDFPQYTWSFAGEMKPGRVKALEAFKRLEGGKMVLTDQGFKPDKQKTSGLISENYFKLLQNSLFVPCPLGWVNIDTQRFYETLEAGAIPVVLKNGSPEDSETSYWKTKFQTIQALPFVEAHSWDEAVEECDYIIKTGQALHARRECHSFWFSLKRHWQKSLRHLIINF